MVCKDVGDLQLSGVKPQEDHFPALCLSFPPPKNKDGNTYQAAVDVAKLTASQDAGSL